MERPPIFRGFDDTSIRQSPDPSTAAYASATTTTTAAAQDVGQPPRRRRFSSSPYNEEEEEDFVDVEHDLDADRDVGMDDDQGEEEIEEVEEEEEEIQEESFERGETSETRPDSNVGPVPGSSITTLFASRSDGNLFYQSPRYVQGDYEWRGEKREIGEEATWTVSSAKPGNGAEQLRDGDTTTYWQSDGLAPHSVMIQFHRRAVLVELAVFINYHLDESYSPKKIIVKSGTTLDDAETVAEVEINEPSGWTIVPLRSCRLDKNNTPVFDQPLKTFMLQLVIAGMHQNGRDTHMRLIRLFGPKIVDGRGPETGGGAGPAGILGAPGAGATSGTRGRGFDMLSGFPSIR